MDIEEIDRQFFEKPHVIKDVNSMSKIIDPEKYKEIKRGSLEYALFKLEFAFKTAYILANKRFGKEVGFLANQSILENIDEEIKTRKRTRYEFKQTKEEFQKWIKS
jgi:hypothetical protein